MRPDDLATAALRRRLPRLGVALVAAAGCAAPRVRSASGGEVQPVARVETVDTGGLLDGPDGAAVDARGDVYVANWAGGKGSTLVRVPANGGRPHVFATGLRAPDGVTVGPDGALYVSNFGDGTVSRVTADGADSVYARGLGRPSGLTFGPDGALYVADFGNYDGTVVRRVARDGGVTTYARGLSAPIGVAFSRDGRLHVSSFGSGEVRRVAPDGTSEVLARVPNEPRAMLQFLAFDGRGNLYVPSYGHNRVYRVAPGGAVDTVAGAGARGGADGDAPAATFDGPNSIVRLPNDDLLVTEYNANRLRRIRRATAAR